MFFQHKSRKSQNVIEVVLIIPLLVVIILGIAEYAIFQKNVSVVQDIATVASVAASKQYVDENIVPADPFTENPAVEAALQIVYQRVQSLGVAATLLYKDMGPAYGKRPFALYEFYSDTNIDYKGVSTPIIQFSVDYRDPTHNGVSTQLIYHHKLILFGFKLTMPGGKTVTFIPNNVQISSTQTKQYISY